jgi:ABC-type lipoprotein release transport system permease subunit
VEDALLAWRNIWRNPRRSALTISAISFATALLVFMLSFQFGAYEDMIDSSVRLSTGHLQIQAKGYLDRPEMRKVVSRPGPLLDMLTTQPEVEAVALRSETFALAAGAQRSRGMLVVGVDPDMETALSSLPGQIIEGRYLQAADREKAIIGVLAAKRLQIGLGDECTILGQGRDGSVAATVVTIVGIFKSGIDEFDRVTLQLPLVDFDEVFSMAGGVHRIIMLVQQLAGAKQAAAQIRAQLSPDDPAVLTWDELSPGLKQSIELDLIGGIIMYVILVLVVAFSILNTFFMAIFERTREFGVLMSIGTTPLRLVKLMLQESMAMTLLGLGIGIGIGIGVTLIFSQVGIGFGDSGELLAQYCIAERLYPRLTVLSVLAGPVIIAVITFFTALIPALKIPRMRPVDAMRAV